MISVVVIFVGAAVILFVVILARHFEARTWRKRLTAYQLVWPTTTSEDAVAGWFESLAAITHRPNWSLLPLPPIVLETTATQQGIEHTLLISSTNKAAVLSSLHVQVPGVRVTELDRSARPVLSHARELTMTSRARPLTIQRASGTATALLAGMQPIPAGATLICQLILTSAGTPAPVKQATQRAGSQPLPWLLEGEAPIDAESVGQRRKKYEQPLLHAVLRVGVGGTDRPQAQALTGRVWSGLQRLNAPGVRLVRRYLPSSVVARRLRTLALPSLHWPLLLNTREVLGVSGIPLGSQFLPGLARGGARQLPAPAALPRRGQVLARGNYPGQAARPLAISTTDRLRHSYFLGPTGSGKSTLLASCILQDIQQRRGCIAIDVKGDLVRDVLARVRPENEDRVVVLEPLNWQRPVGLNVLEHVGSDASRELVVDNVVHVFRELWHGFWGPRTDWVIRSGLSTLTRARTPDNRHYTLIDLGPLLTNPAFRRSLLRRTNLPPDLVSFWQRYEVMSDAERSQVIGPSLNKLDAFSSRTAIRLLLGQSSGIDLAEIFTQRAAVLVSLDKGQLGSETANLLGALILSTLWSATLARSAVPADRRRPAFAYIDEAQDIVRLPLAIADMLAQARGYGLGITLANQYVAQLPEAVRKAVLGTVRTQVTFAVDHDDARILERRFAPLTAEELQALGTYEVAIRASVGGQTLAPVTGTTVPLQEAQNDPTEVAARAAARRGRARTDVELEAQARVGEGIQAQTFGRERRTGGSV